jgi:LysR family transcriptional activator of nhaA
MRHLNYSHLQYFWAIVREGSVVRAAEALHLTPQTLSGQLKVLEDNVGTALFSRVGRRLVLTEMGHTVFKYADEIFAIGTELASVVRGQRAGGPRPLNIGIVNSMPKLVAERIIAPAFGLDESISINCHEAALEPLLGSLATHRLDLVLSDQPMPQGLSLRAYSHLLGESELSFFARRNEARRYKGKFPHSLNGAPMLLPSRSSALRRRLDDWFEARGLAPRTAGEFDDSALMKAFGEAGAGIFPGPRAIEAEICRMFRAAVVGRAPDIAERFYAISPERRLKHPAVVLIAETAREDLFA